MNSALVSDPDDLTTDYGIVICEGWERSNEENVSVQVRPTVQVQEGVPEDIAPGGMGTRRKRCVDRRYVVELLGKSS